MCLDFVLCSNGDALAPLSISTLPLLSASCLKPSLPNPSLNIAPCLPLDHHMSCRLRHHALLRIHDPQGLHQILLQRMHVPGYLAQHKDVLRAVALGVGVYGNVVRARARDVVGEERALRGCGGRWF